MCDNGILQNLKNDVDLMLNEITESVCVDTRTEKSTYTLNCSL